jgi:hypothetical protein
VIYAKISYELISQKKTEKIYRKHNNFYWSVMDILGYKYNFKFHKVWISWVLAISSPILVLTVTDIGVRKHQQRAHHHLAMNHGNPIGLQNSLPIMVSISSKNLLTPEINYMKNWLHKNWQFFHKSILHIMDIVQELMKLCINSW